MLKNIFPVKYFLPLWNMVKKILIPMKILVFAFVNQFRNAPEINVSIKYFSQKDSTTQLTHGKRCLILVGEELDLATIYSVLLLDLRITVLTS